MRLQLRGSEARSVTSRLIHSKIHLAKSEKFDTMERTLACCTNGFLFQTKPSRISGYRSHNSYRCCRMLFFTAAVRYIGSGKRS